MSVKNEKLKQVSGEASGQRTHYSTGKGFPTYTVKFNLKKIDASGYLQKGRNKVIQAGGHRRNIQIKPLPPQYPDSLFASKEEYDAMIRGAVEDGKSGKAIIRRTPLSRDLD
jgi:hypothetical protein